MIIVLGKLWSGIDQQVNIQLIRKHIKDNLTHQGGSLSALNKMQEQSINNLGYVILRWLYLYGIIIGVNHFNLTLFYNLSCSGYHQTLIDDRLVLLMWLE